MNELILQDRLNVIKDVINSKGEDIFYLSYSGGKDSTIIHYLLDMALPNNRITRLFIDTGIEYNHIREYIYQKAKEDERIEIIKPMIPIKQTLEKYGYPFKSKEHSDKLYRYSYQGMTDYVRRYVDSVYKDGRENTFGCPKMLRFQFDESYPLKISDLCCRYMRKKPSKDWMEKNHKQITITGMRRAEKGRRTRLACLTDTRFHPLAVVDDEWEEWFIEKYKIKLCDLYYPPFNFKRTGCKGCPLAIDLQEELDKMEELLPNERKQCETIWKPVYDEYRRLNYRLKDERQTSLF